MDGIAVACTVEVGRHIENIVDISPSVSYRRFRYRFSRCIDILYRQDID